VSSFNIPALGLSGIAIAGAAVLQSVYSTSPRRVMMWNATDDNGAPLLDAKGNPVQAELSPQVTLQERAFDALRITDHPVEQGAAITDHAYKLPAQVTIRGGWSYASGSILSGPLPSFTDSSLLVRFYSTLLGLQKNRTLVTLVTGKRKYPNMLLETLGQDTDEKTENVLMFTANFKEVIIAQTQLVVVPPANVMKTPQLNGATQNQGQTALLSGSAINAPAANAILGGAPSGPGILGGG
jgi:hypothetical protein